MVRRLLVPLMALGLLALAPSSVLPAFGGVVPGGPFCESSDDTVHAGQNITVFGDNWFPNTRVRVHFAQDGSQLTPIAVGRADDSGMIAIPATIPGFANLGPASLICKGKGPEGNRGGDRDEITVVPCLPSGPPVRGC